MRNQFNRDLEDELRFHEEMKAHALADADGKSGDEARAAARRRIGNPQRLREQSREPWIFATVETLARDVRHALRLMQREPAFTFTVVGDTTRQPVLVCAVDLALIVICPCVVRRVVAP